MRHSEGFPAKWASFAIGMLSLATETLWVRTFSFLGKSTPTAVSTILGTYLLGIAFGAVLGARICRTRRREGLAQTLTTSLLAASVVILASPPILAAVADATGDALFPVAFRAVTALCLAFLPAFIFSICFPICHHLGTKIEFGKTGKGMSRVYAANIAGSVVGPILVNFAILQFATTQLAFAIIGIIGVSAGIALRSFAERQSWYRVALAGCVVLGVATFLAASRSDNWLIKSLESSTNKLAVSRVVETRQGIIVSYRDEKFGDVIYGGNVYDGRTNLDPRINSNGLARILVTAALRPNPKKILEIGLSVGTWNYILTGFPGVEKIDIVEINPGYLDLIKDYPKQQRALSDPRVNLRFGDGRKFLRTAPEGVYDLVVMNTTWHWRAYTSLLLSREFLTLVRSRMAPSGLLAFNATGSNDALYTAASVFPNCYRYDSFVMCADFDWREALERPESIAQLLKISPESTPLLTNADTAIAERFLSRKHTTDIARAAVISGRPLEIITDRNLLTEYKYGRSMMASE